MKKIKLSKIRFAGVFCGALAVAAAAAGIAAAANSGDRFACLAKVKGRYFTDGVVTMKEYPCKADPAAVDGMVKAKYVDEKTDQVNFDYLWSQEYYTVDTALVDVRKMGKGAGYQANPVLPPVVHAVAQPAAQPAAVVALDRIGKLKAAYGFRCAEDLTARAEVALYAAAHEEEELGWRHALPWLRAAECLLAGAEERAAACPLCVSMNIQFPTDEATILPAYWNAIARVAAFMKALPEVNLRVEGHTDNEFSLDYNRGLSQRRANAVRQELIFYGIKGSRLTALGFGPTRPIADNSSLAERHRNRRVIAVPVNQDGEIIPYYQCSSEKPPEQTDADGDGVMDFMDKCPGTPKDASVDEYGCASINLNIEFDVKAATLRPGNEDQLQRLANLLLAEPAATAEIQGHTDNSGSRDENYVLSQARAEAVRDFLIARYRIAPDRLTARGYGQDEPAAPNDTPENKQANRRVVAEIDLHR